MKTLVVVPHHRNHQQYYDRNPGHSAKKLGAFEDVAAGQFQGINCRTSHCGEGLLPTPTKSCSSTIPVIKRAFSASFSPKTPSPTSNGSHKSSKRNTKGCAIPIPFNIKFPNNYRSANDGFRFSERWAGPAYSNSPPPSSLPMPKFPFQPTRTVSLDLANSPPENDLCFVMKSAPASPSRENILPGDLYNSPDSATKTLRRILNLDITDD
ncbi:hypothetical protein F511_17225 [Dorcoceras hygrometricum]|uniref:Uncharacterized protein n=1 Tax=Dorcoceras hygrometricum TaxID=472368 RepID=A0A2Z7B1P8_9LAMI|nr:hypothetical protein F511_17225 [Dorcoceras hygrometricum]